MTKALFTGVLAALVAIAVVPASARPAKRQKVEGSIAVAAPYPPDSVCFTGLHRRLRLLTHSTFPNGVVGYDFEVDPKTIGRNFVLQVPEGSDADLDVSFYAGMGDTSDPAGAPPNVSFETRESGGEAGQVPAGFDKAIVCMYSGSATDFVYRAGKGVKAPKG